MNAFLQELFVQYAGILALITLRIISAILLVPVFSGKAVSMRIRGALALLIALILTPVAKTTPELTGLTPMIAAAFGEILIGLAMGLVVRISFYAAEFAGGALGLQMGLAFSQVVDPLSQEQTPISSRLLGLFATLILVVLGGHRLLLAGLATSVVDVPIGGVFSHFSSPEGLIGLLSTATTTGLRIAAPVMVALFLANVGLALLARAAPQLQLFVLSFGISIVLGTLILTNSSEYGLTLLAEQVQQIETLLASVLGG